MEVFLDGPTEETLERWKESTERRVRGRWQREREIKPENEMFVFGLAIVNHIRYQAPDSLLHQEQLKSLRLLRNRLL